MIMKFLNQLLSGFMVYAIDELFESSARYIHFCTPQQLNQGIIGNKPAGILRKEEEKIEFMSA